jgi:hypothetical protein
MLVTSLKPSLGALGAAFVGVLTTQASHALEWTYTPAVTMESGGDSNLYLSPFNQLYRSHDALTASAEVAARNPGFQFRFEPEVRALRYAHNREADRNDAFARFDIALNNERRRWSFGGNYARDSTLTSEFENSGLLGLNQEQVQRSFDTSWSRVMSSRGSVNFSAVVANTAYADSAASPLVDYGYRTVQAGYTLNTAPRSSWQFGISRSDLDGTSPGENLTNTALHATWSHVFSGRLHGEFGLSAFDVGATGSNLDRHLTTGMSFALTREWPRWTFRSSGGRDIRPEGRATFAREDAVTLEASRRFRDRLSITTSLRGARFAAAGLLADFFDRRYSQTGVAANWQMTQRWVLSGALFKRAQESAFVPRAEGLLSTLAVSYRGR